MTVVTALPARITHVEHLGGGSGKHAIDCRRRCAIDLALLRQFTETTSCERDKRTRAFLKPNASLQLLPEAGATQERRLEAVSCKACSSKPLTRQ